MEKINNGDIIALVCIVLGLLSIFYTKGTNMIVFSILIIYGGVCGLIYSGFFEGLFLRR